MSESVISKYKWLFEIRLLHHYWLDDGATVFDSLPEADRTKRLQSYDCSRFFVIAPTTGTGKLLNRLRCVYKNTALGCVVAAPSNVVILDDTIFAFVVTVRDADFFNYTALTLLPRKIYEFYYAPEKKTYRYKENTPVLSNLNGAVREAEQEGNVTKFRKFFLSKEFPILAVDDRVESLFVEKNALKQLISDQPKDNNQPEANVQELAALATKSPVYVHQGDIPVITPPVGLTGAPSRGLLLSDDIPDDVFTVIEIKINTNDVNGHAKGDDDALVFEARFKNRSTYWRYIKNGKQENESGPYPLTYFGNAAKSGKKPSHGIVKIEKEEQTGRIKKFISEIFI